jgi:hypothetical protein
VGQGMLKGGALGMLGDIVGLTAQGRYQSAAEYAAGPLIGDTDRLLSGIHGLAGQAAREGASCSSSARKTCPATTSGTRAWSSTGCSPTRSSARSTPTTTRARGDGEARRRQWPAILLGAGRMAPRRAPDFSNAVSPGGRTNDARNHAAARSTMSRTASRLSTRSRSSSRRRPTSSARGSRRRRDRADARRRLYGRRRRRATGTIFRHQDQAAGTSPARSSASSA